MNDDSNIPPNYRFVIGREAFCGGSEWYEGWCSWGLDARKAERLSVEDAYEMAQRSSLHDVEHGIKGRRHEILYVPGYRLCSHVLVGCVDGKFDKDFGEVSLLIQRAIDVDKPEGGE